MVARSVVALIKYHQSEDGEGAKDPFLDGIHKNLGRQHNDVTVLYNLFYRYMCNRFTTNSLNRISRKKRQKIKYDKGCLAVQKKI